MLQDIITLVLIIYARDRIAAQQFLRELSCKPKCSDYPPTMDYAKVILLRAAVLTSSIDGRSWLESVFD